jgi:hypothetical protein
VEADAVVVAEGNTEAPKRPGAKAPPGSKSEARVRRFRRNLGDPALSSSRNGGRDDSGNNDPARAGSDRTRGSPAGDTKDRTRTGYRQAKATKRGGKGRRKSEPPMVPKKVGNSTTRTQWREGAAEAENRTRER